jgi:hypothetical protein
VGSWGLLGWLRLGLGGFFLDLADGAERVRWNGRAFGVVGVGFLLVLLGWSNGVEGMHVLTTNIAM